MPTLLCVPILVQDEAKALADARAARDAGADIVEFRIDELFSGTIDSNGNLDPAEVTSILRLIAESPLPTIVTCRSAAEGGAYDGDDMARVALYERLGTADPSVHAARLPGGVGPRFAEHPPRYLDIELATYTRSANLMQKINLAVDWPQFRREPRPGLIISMHDLEGRPRDLLRKLAEMRIQEAARITKIAYTARSIRDNLELFDLLAENASGRPMIALAMGRFGLMSRVLAPKFGAFLTFASLTPQTTTAPGQPTIRDLLDIYNFRDITPRTRVYGLIGWPVEQSLSPIIHNAGFESLAPADDWESPGRKSEVGGRRSEPKSTVSPPTSHLPPPASLHDAIYLPLPVPPEYEHFKATLSALIDHPRLDFSGCSVTVPHKQHLVRFARERIDADDEIEWSLDALSATSGAANTLAITRDRLGSARTAAVTNTDGPAAREALETALGAPVKSKRIAILGAGGAARAIAAELLTHGASIFITNRTPETADRLARELKSGGTGGSPASGEPLGSIRSLPLSELVSTPIDALINCTPVGMTGGPDPTKSPIDIEPLRTASPQAIIMDTVYNPLNTPLLEQATLAGLRTIDGLAMFIRQAGAQFTAWTGAPAPLRLFEQICREALQAR